MRQILQHGGLRVAFVAFSLWGCRVSPDARDNEPPPALASLPDGARETAVGYLRQMEVANGGEAVPVFLDRENEVRTVLYFRLKRPGYNDRYGRVVLVPSEAGSADLVSLGGYMIRSYLPRDTSWGVSAFESGVDLCRSPADRIWER